MTRTYTDAELDRYEAMMTPEERTASNERVFLAFHEGAHAVATVLCGGRVEVARLINNDPTQLGTCNTLETRERDDALIAYAGPYGEAVARSERGAHLEVRKIARQLLSASGRGDQAVIDHARASDAMFSDRHHSIEKHINTCWRAVTGVALKLIEGPVTHADVTKALGLSADPDIAAHQLHLIKSGHRPGTFVVTNNGGQRHATTGLRPNPLSKNG